MIDYLNKACKIYDDNILNIDTERFFREAEDYFFYFNRQDLAIENLQTSIKLTPNHHKSIKFLGDIYFTIGKIEKAFDFYSQAAALRPDDTSVLSSLATACEALGDYENALAFLNVAFEKYTIKEVKIYAQMCDLKTSLLLKLQKYEEAKKFLNRIKKNLPSEDVKIVETSNHTETLKKKLSLKERMENLNIKVV